MFRTVATASESVPFKGRLMLTVLDPDGRVVDEREGDNVVCTTGYTAIAAALATAAA